MACVYSLVAYGEMIADRIRTDAYALALQRQVKSGNAVVDIGTGTAILAMLACRSGARRVYAFEPARIVDLGKEIAAANGFADRIEFIPRISMEVSLPEAVDVVVSDVHGILPFYGRGLVSLIDARERFLAPGGRMIPASDTVWIAGLRAPEIYKTHLGGWDGRPYDFEATAARLRRVNSIEQCEASAEQIFLEARCLATLDYHTITETELDTKVSWTVDQAGEGHGLALWFDSVLAEGITLTNRPGAPRLIYRQAFFPWPETLHVSPGDTVTVTISARMVGDDYVWRWDTQLMSAGSTGAAKMQFRQSTFWGGDFSLAELHTSASKFRPKLNLDGLIQRRILSLMEGDISLKDISLQLVKDFPDRFKQWQDAYSLVSELSRNFAG